MVGYLKQHFFVRYRSFESWVHLNQLAEQWLAAEADPRIHARCMKWWRNGSSGKLRP